MSSPSSTGLSCLLFHVRCCDSSNSHQDLVTFQGLEPR
jgi:hypothetical protein